MRKYTMWICVFNVKAVRKERIQLTVLLSSPSGNFWWPAVGGQSFLGPSPAKETQLPQAAVLQSGSAAVFKGCMLIRLWSASQRKGRSIGVKSSSRAPSKIRAAIPGMLDGWMDRWGGGWRVARGMSGQLNGGMHVGPTFRLPWKNLDDLMVLHRIVILGKC